ncbi:MAG: membrane protein insertion efficiency factor YidD [Kiritimatiellae bacterium]|nr:membrane protein insertion efficiency factor YidD [Kiritimatiellia bacterium]
MSGILIFLVRLYQLVLWPFFGQCCRFYPSCSVYFIEAVRQWGSWQGTFLGVRRLCKCHPFHPGGFDPVPAKKPH